MREPACVGWCVCVCALSCMSHLSHSSVSNQRLDIAWEISQGGCLDEGIQAAKLTRGKERMKTSAAKQAVAAANESARALWGCVKNVVDGAGAKGLLDPSLQDVSDSCTRTLVCLCVCENID